MQMESLGGCDKLQNRQQKAEKEARSVAEEVAQLKEEKEARIRACVENQLKADEAARIAVEEVAQLKHCPCPSPLSSQRRNGSTEPDSGPHNQNCCFCVFWYRPSERCHEVRRSSLQMETPNTEVCKVCYSASVSHTTRNLWLPLGYERR